MKTPFRIKFCKEVFEPSNKTILDKFEVNFNNSYCDNMVVLNNNKLIVRNEIIRIKPDWNWNIWSGIGYAEITIFENLENKNKRVEYVIDYTRSAISAILFLVFISFIMMYNLPSEEFYFFFKIVLFFLIPVVIISKIITLSRQKSMFLRTLDTPIENVGNYNWKEILKNKNKHELIDIISGKTQLPDKVVELAKTEFERRQIETK